VGDLGTKQTSANNKRKGGELLLGFLRKLELGPESKGGENKVRKIGRVFGWSFEEAGIIGWNQQARKKVVVGRWVS
jgi:hypothetical protein